MILELGIRRKELNETLNGLKKAASIQEETYEDFNLVTDEETNTLQIFVRHFDLFQVVHTISNSGTTTLNVNYDQKMVFDPDVITSLIKKSRSGELELRFFDDEFLIKMSDSWFSKPTTFTLNMFNESQFQHLIQISGFESILSIDRKELVENLEMMSIVSNVVKFRLEEGKFWMTVEDAVHGKGEVMEPVDTANITNDKFEYQYSIEIIQSFLKSLKSDEIILSMNGNGVLRIHAERPGHSAELTLAHRIDR